jgi:hypothetical protein
MERERGSSSKMLRQICSTVRLLLGKYNKPTVALHIYSSFFVYEKIREGRKKGNGQRSLCKERCYF